MAFSFSTILEGLNFVKTGLDKWIPDAKDRLEATQLIVKQEHELIMAQLDINKVEAASESVFTSGWRPAAGWVCVASLFYAVLGHDILEFSLQLLGQFIALTVPVLPEPNVSITMELLVALLGLGAFRSYEKKHRVHK